MTPDPALVEQVGQLRLPLSAPDGSPDWKEWFHYVLFSPDHQIRVLANFALSGRPGEGEINVTLLVTLAHELAPKVSGGGRPFATFGSAVCAPWTPGSVRARPLRIRTDQAELALDGARTMARVRDSRARLALEFTAGAAATPLVVTEASAFGSGFLGWGLVPRLQVQGSVSVCGRKFPITRQWFGYHDHNFGRFFWGEDIGWEWGVFTGRTAAGREWTLVLDRRTDRNHARGGLAYVFVLEESDLRKVYLGPAVSIGWDWQPQAGPVPRLPGAMASLFQDRQTSRPSALDFRGEDEADSQRTKFLTESAVELVVPDNQRRQYTFMKELTGSASIQMRLAGETIAVEGTGYAEYVH